MRHIANTVMIFGALGLSACSNSGPESKMADRDKTKGERSQVVSSASPAGERLLNEGELSKREARAAQGDPDAALDVAFHYANVSNGKPMARQWLTIAAENGAPLGMHLLSGELFSDGGRVNCERALFWLGRLAEHKKYVAGHPEPNFIEKEKEKIRASLDRCR